MQQNFPEIKEMLFKKESELSPYASKSYESKGRQIKEESCPFRTDFERDRDRILHSKAFRRLKRKTQVFFAPQNDHLRTRLTHTLEVSQISRTISSILNLNEDLTEAIALGHDLGHTPFGHSGEDALNSVCTNGFKHNEHSIRVIEVIEKLNLCEETLDGILCHTGKVIPKTLEGQAVRISDRVAYIAHDIEDAIRAGVMTVDDIPKNYKDYFGNTKDSMLDKIIADIYITSKDKPSVQMSKECEENLNGLRSWMFDHVYHSKKTKGDEEELKEKVIKLFQYYKEQEGEQEAIDYVAGMSDEFALQEYEKIYKK